MSLYTQFFNDTHFDNICFDIYYAYKLFDIDLAFHWSQQYKYKKWFLDFATSKQNPLKNSLPFDTKYTK